MRTLQAFSIYKNGLRGFDVTGKTVMEFGCGALNPTEIATVFWLNGAERVIAIDKLPCADQERARSDLASLLKDCQAHPEKWLLPHSSRELFLERLSQESAVKHIVGNVLTCLSEPQSFDLILSSAVLEHVPAADLRQIAAHFRKLLRPSGLAYHNVDYSDHGIHSDPTLNYWSFMTEGHEVPNIEDGGDINKLRDCEMQALFEGAGFSLEMDPLFVQEPPQHVLDALLPKYRGLSVEELSLVSTGLRMWPLSSNLPDYAIIADARPAPGLSPRASAIL